MPTCYSPISGYKRPGGGISHTRAGAFRDLPVTIPCGKCIGCRLEKARDWAVRITHEAQMHKENSFLTLTYNDEHLPPGGTLRPRDMELFIKRLRAALAPRQIRFYQCGEYGDEDKRAHHHMILFGEDFHFDRKFFKTSKSGEKIYISEVLNDIWKNGYATVQDFTYKTASYVARYAIKKITGPPAKEHYERVDMRTGEPYQLVPECATMSLRPGIGAEWFKKYHSDVFPSDEVIIKGKTQKPPKYYSVLYERMNPEGFKKLRQKRAKDAKQRAGDNTPQRLLDKEKVKIAQTKSLKRN